jgi:hypothetical protein
VLWTVLHRTLLESWYLAVQPEAGSVCWTEDYSNAGHFLRSDEFEDFEHKINVANVD